MKQYRVNEIFQSLQGEGVNTGCVAVFLRLSGCNRKCAFCDTDHHQYRLMSAGEIVAAVSGYPSRLIVVTGGEPLLQLDDELISALHDAGFRIAVETNGSLPIPEGVDWVTCSPKESPWLIDRIDELKILWLKADDSERVERLAKSLPAAKVMSLQPLTASDGSNNLDDLMPYLMAHPCWRLSLQLHRLLGIR